MIHASFRAHILTLFCNSPL